MRDDKTLSGDLVASPITSEVLELHDELLNAGVYVGVRVARERTPQVRFESGYKVILGADAIKAALIS